MVTVQTHLRTVVGETAPAIVSTCPILWTGRRSDRSGQHSLGPAHRGVVLASSDRGWRRTALCTPLHGNPVMLVHAATAATPCGDSCCLLPRGCRPTTHRLKILGPDEAKAVPVIERLPVTDRITAARREWRVAGSIPLRMKGNQRQHPLRIQHLDANPCGLLSAGFRPLPSH